MHRLFIWLPMLLTFASCSSPPKPPTVDETQKRPANTRTAVELQACKAELQDTRIAADEVSRVAETTFANASRLVAAADAARQAAQQAARASAAAPPPRNAVYTVRFAFGSTRLEIAERDAARLVSAAREAAFIVLKGRTDATAETPAEASIARQRAAAVRAFLETAGVEPMRIRSTWQAAGDHAADNSTIEGRAANRRVEIEIYRSTPQSAVAFTSADALAGDRRQPPTTNDEVQHAIQR